MNEKIAISGWLEESKEAVIPFIQNYQKEGIQYVICTDISTDGMLEGPSFELYQRILDSDLSNRAESRLGESILDNLDAQILYDKVLFPLLGIEDLRNDERIDYIPGKQSISVIKDLIDEGEFEVGFMLYPSDINEIKALADNNLIMPPKSTYIEQKFRSGLVVYEL